jgi:hypothetical protein
MTLHAKCISLVSHPQKKKHPTVSRRVFCFHNPVWDYILTLHAKCISPLSHPQKKKTPHGFPEGVTY